MEKKRRYGRDQKTTIELPKQLLRDAKATAARRGTSLKTLIQEALSEKLSQVAGAEALREAPRPWLEVPPISPPLSVEDRRLFDEALEDLERIDPEDEL